MKNSEVRNHIRALVEQKRNYKQEIKDIIKQYEYVVFYGCGKILHSIIDTWDEHIGRKIDYVCDSDSKKWGVKFCGIECISPQQLMKIKDKCAVFVTIGKFKPVLDFLKENEVASVNQIYKYDIVASDYFEGKSHHEIIEKLCQSYELMSDQKSIEVFDAIVQRVFNHKIDTDVMRNICEDDQYFSPDIIKLSEHESLVDIGTFNGDTVSDFIQRTNGKFDNIYSFELDSVNFKDLEYNVSKMPERDRITIFNMGIWDSECDITYSVGESQSTVGKGEAHGHVVPLDDIMKNKEISFIKMDIEGAEVNALRGAKNVIKTQRPKLAICIYHDFKHLWEIPLYIKSLVPEYKIYLRHYTNMEYETVCYAIPTN